jgi:hypothetical protein
MLRTILFFSLITSAHANLDNLVNAANSFAACDLPANRDGPKRSVADRLCGKNQLLRASKISFLDALRVAMPQTG